MAGNEYANLDIARQTFCFILAGGRGSRLKDLTDNRCKPAVYFGGKFRIIDFALSNCLNSNMRRIAVLTQYKAHSLIRHLQHGWGWLRSDFNEFIDIVPAQQQIDESSWYRGTADAVYQNLQLVRSYGAKYIVVLAGDHIYKMDYRMAVMWHRDHRKPVSVGCIEVDQSEASEFGVMDVDDDYRVKSFLEKPADPPSMPGKPGTSLASMGIYVFDSEWLIEALERDAKDENSDHDFGRNIIPRAVQFGDAIAHPLEASSVGRTRGNTAYWRDVGTLDAYWEANIDLTDTVPALNLYDRTWPVWTLQEQLPPAKFVHNWDERRGMAVESLVSGGCIISGAVTGSLLFSNCRAHSYSTVNRSVLLPGVDVGRRAQLHNCIVDRGVRIPDNMTVGIDSEADRQRFYVTQRGITLVTQKMVDRVIAQGG